MTYAHLSPLRTKKVSRDEVLVQELRRKS